MQTTPVVYSGVPEPLTSVCSVEGNHKFYLEVFQSEKKMPLCTSSIKLGIKRYKTDSVAFAVSVKWYRVHAQRTQELREHEDKIEYHCSTLDIGCELKVVIKPFDPSYGTASLKFGIIKFDSDLRGQLENVLLSKFSKYNATLIAMPSSSSIHPSNPLMNLLVSNNHIMLSHLHLKVKEVFNQQYACEILNSDPKFETPSSEDPRDVVMYVKDLVESPHNYHSNPPYEQCTYEYSDHYKLKLRFTSRMLKEVFIASVRLVRTVNQISLAELFRNLDTLMESGKMFTITNTLSTAEILLEYDHMREELARARHELKQKESKIGSLTTDIGNLHLEILKLREDMKKQTGSFAAHASNLGPMKSSAFVTTLPPSVTNSGMWISPPSRSALKGVTPNRGDDMSNSPKRKSPSQQRSKVRMVAPAFRGTQKSCGTQTDYAMAKSLTQQSPVTSTPSKSEPCNTSTQNNTSAEMEYLKTLRQQIREIVQQKESTSVLMGFSKKFFLGEPQQDPEKTFRSDDDSMFDFDVLEIKMGTKMKLVEFENEKLSRKVELLTKQLEQTRAEKNESKNCTLSTSSHTK